MDVAPAPDESALEAAQRYLDHVSDTLGIAPGSLVAEETDAPYEPTAVRMSDEAAAAASRYFAANGFPVSEFAIEPPEPCSP